MAPFNGSYEFSRTLDRSRDAILRDTGFQLKTGTIAAHFEYDPFGNTVVNTDTGNLRTPLP